MNKEAETSRKVLKILVADDDPAVTKALASRCESMGFEVATATNGMKALLTARITQPDILIVDINMPELDGLSVSAHLLDPRRRPIDVIVITGRHDPQEVMRCESMGLHYGQKGVDFWKSISLALAVIVPEMAETIKRLGMPPMATKVPSRSRVLVVDDDPDVYGFLSSRLGKRGVDTLYAPDATRGWQMACREEPSVVISDYFMPNGGAPYLLGKLRSTPATKNIPVVVLSGQKLDKEIEQSVTREICGQPGAVGVLMKSFDTELLFESLQRFCGFHKADAHR